MESTATTLVTALINEGRQQHGRIDRLAVPQDLFDQVLDEVVSAGGEVGFESCTVDGVTVTAGATADGTPLVTPAGHDAPVPLTRAPDG
jgi:hypothetical protein